MSYNLSELKRPVSNSMCQISIFESTNTVSISSKRIESFIDKCVLDSAYRLFSYQSASFK